MDILLGDESSYLKTLRKIEQIRQIANGELSLPQICVAGNQSSGKSSLLGKLLTGLEMVLPQAAGICTRCPIVVNLKRRNDESSISINSMKYSWTDSGRLDAKRSIENEQNKLLQQDGENLPNKLVSSSEILVNIIHPNVTDLVLVDLPGLIQDSEDGNENDIKEIENMVRNYIKRKECFVLVVRPANDDKQSSGAMRIAREADKNQTRTLKVFTKCDFFSSDANKKSFFLEMNEPATLKAHAVCCNPQGKEHQSLIAEDAFFEEHSEFNNLENKGTRILVEKRLPVLLDQLIKTNIPSLQRQIDDKMSKVEEKLREIGIEGLSKKEIHRSFIKLLKEKAAELDVFLTKTVRIIETQLHETEEIITLEWIHSMVEDNAFEPWFFQGLKPFQRCISEISDKFMNISKTNTDCIFEELTQIIMNVGLNKQISDIAMSHVMKLWQDHRKIMKQNMDNKLDQLKQDTASYNTLNDHYLSSKYQKELVIPDYLIEQLATQVTMEDALVAKVQERSRQIKGGHWIIEQHGEPAYYSDSKLQEAISKKLKQAAEGYYQMVSNYNSRQQQERLVLAAMKSYFPEMKKVFGSKIVAFIRFEYIQSFTEKFIGCTLSNSEEFLTLCDENEKIFRERKDALSLREKMITCHEMLNSI